jgi:phage baseplate assembly protein W
MASIGIFFPFTESETEFIKQTTTTNDEIRSSLTHLLLTNKGERYYKPDFGTNLRNFIFNPNDNTTYEAMREEVKTAVNRYFPQLQITDIIINANPNNERSVDLQIKYINNASIFGKQDTINITI